MRLKLEERSSSLVKRKCGSSGLNFMWVNKNRHPESQKLVKLGKNKLMVKKKS